MFHGPADIDLTKIKYPKVLTHILFSLVKILWFHYVLRSWEPIHTSIHALWGRPACLPDAEVIPRNSSHIWLIFPFQRVMPLNTVCIFSIYLNFIFIPNPDIASWQFPPVKHIIKKVWSDLFSSTLLDLLKFCYCPTCLFLSVLSEFAIHWDCTVIGRLYNFPRFLTFRARYTTGALYLWQGHWLIPL